MGPLFEIIPEKRGFNCFSEVIHVYYPNLHSQLLIIHDTHTNDDAPGLRSRIKMTYKASSVPDYEWLNWSSIIVPAVAWKSLLSAWTHPSQVRRSSHKSNLCTTSATKGVREPVHISDHLLRASLVYVEKSMRSKIMFQVLQVTTKIKKNLAH